MKILLTGASGLLGYAFAQAAKRRKHEVIGIVGSYEEPITELNQQKAIDLNDLAALERFVLEQFPDVIVNCAAMSIPALCESNPSASERINILVPEKLALLSRHLFARFIHISTDQVFDGTSAPYFIGDPPNPSSIYSMHKAESEKRVRDMASEFASIIRIPLLNGNSPRGNRSLHEHLLAAWSRGEKAHLFADEYRQPCLSDNLADAMVELCERNDLQGLLHWAGADPLSRFEIGQRILNHFGLSPDLISKSNRGNHPEHSRRQENLTLDLQPLAGRLKTRPQPFSEQLESLIVPKQFRAWYNAI
jgi:dTDP-4-dehydrorhamnose reductase